LTAGSSNSRLLVTPTETVFNEQSADLDFRIESDGNTNAFFLEGSSGNIGIGNISPSTKLQVTGNSSSRNTIVSNVTLDGGTTVANPYEGFGFGINFIGRDYGNAVRNYASINTFMQSKSSSSGGGDAGFTTGLSFYTNGGGASGTNPEERLRIDSSGNVGIGCTPATGVRLDIRSNATTNIGDFRNASATGFGLYVAAGDTSSQYAFRAADYQNNALFSVMGDGNVGVGTSSPATKLTVSGGYISQTDGTISTYLGSDGTGSLLGTTTNHYLRFLTNNTERLRIDTAGNFLLGTTSAISLGKTSVLFDGTNQNGFIVKTTRSATGSAFAGFVNSSGTVIGSISQDSSSTVNYITSSDQRLKENITDSDDSGNVIDAIQVRKFNWIADGAHEKYGFIAQELKAVVPNAVSSMGLPDDEDPMLGVDPSKLMAIAIKEIQMLRARVAKLENT